MSPPNVKPCPWDEIPNGFRFQIYRDGPHITVERTHIPGPGGLPVLTTNGPVGITIDMEAQRTALSRGVDLVANAVWEMTDPDFDIQPGRTVMEFNAEIWDAWDQRKTPGS